MAEADRLREGLPPKVQATLPAHEAAGTTADPASVAAVAVLNARHVCRVVPMPHRCGAPSTPSTPTRRSSTR